MDIGEQYTERQMAQIERRLYSVYKEAERDMGKKLREFNKAYKARDAKYRAAVKAGEMSKADYQAWQQGQVFQGKQWEARREQMAKSLYNANKNAMAIVNNTRFNVFAENANFMEYEIGMGAGMVGAQFGLYDANTVKRLVAQEPRLLPPSKVSYPKDMAWNMKKITRAVTQGIVEGEDIDTIAGRMADVTGSSQQAMVLHARTAMTGAQNAGRIEGMKAAQALGLKVKKQWMSTLDSRTRDSHQDLDGQVQEVKDPFQSILGDIMYPGDPGAEPANVYNCRCTLIYVFDDEKFTGQRRDNEKGTDIEYKTYNEWKGRQPRIVVEQKKPKAAPEVAIRAKHEAALEALRSKTKKLAEAMSSEDYEALLELLSNSEAETLYIRYADACAGIRTGKRGVYIPKEDAVVYSLGNKEGRSRYSTLCHEMAHMFDARVRVKGFTYEEAEAVLIEAQNGFRVKVSLSDQFLAALRADREGLKKLLASSSEMRTMLSGAWNNSSAGVQDAIDGFFNTLDKGATKWGHGGDYYDELYRKKVANNRSALEPRIVKAYKRAGINVTKETVKDEMRIYRTASEAWANCVSAIAVGGEELRAFEKYMPNTLRAAREIIRGLS